MLLLLIAPAGAAITWQCSVQGLQGYSALMYGHCFSLHCSCKPEPPALESMDFRQHVSGVCICRSANQCLSGADQGQQHTAARPHFQGDE